MDSSDFSLRCDSGASATVQWTDERVMVHVAGEVDECFAAAGAEVIDMLVRLGRPVEVDLSAVTFFGAAGVNWLVTLTSSVTHGVRLVRRSAVVGFVLGACHVTVAPDAEERIWAGEER